MTIIQAQDSRQQRDDALVTPITFRVDAEDSATTLYTGRDDAGLLIREISWSNTTSGAMTFSVDIDSAGYLVSNAAAANSSGKIEALTGLYIDPGADIEVTASAGTGLVVFGWGLRIKGARSWLL